MRCKAFLCKNKRQEEGEKGSQKNSEAVFRTRTLDFDVPNSLTGLTKFAHELATGN